jgi:hypothetical protein
MIRDLGFEILGAADNRVVERDAEGVALKSRDERLSPARD